MDFKIISYSFYILMWPTLSLGVLLYILRAVWKDAQAAKKANESII